MEVEAEKLNEFVKKFSGKKIAVIGDVALDHYIYGVVDRINPERPSAPLLRHIGDDFRLGCAANVVMNLATLGAETYLYGVIGHDKSGEQIKKECEKAGIRCIFINSGSTLVKQRLVEKAHGGYISRVDLGEADLLPLDESEEDEIFNQIKNFNGDAVLLSDYNKRMFKGGLGKRIISHFNAIKIPVFVDPKPANISSFVDAYLIRPNEKETRIIAGYEYQDKNIDEVAKKVKEIARCDNLVITLGAKGMFILDGDSRIIPTKAREVIDVSGAGDTVLATLALAKVSGANLYEAAQIANYAAGIVVEKTGTATVNAEELMSRIKEEHDGNK